MVSTSKTHRCGSRGPNASDHINYKFAVFDTETTLTGKGAQICQLSAIIAESGHCFNKFILPTCNISHHASVINGLFIKTIKGIWTLLKDKNLVPTIFQNFAKFIYSGDNNSHTGLIGHNSTVFDTTTLLHISGLAFKQWLSSPTLFFADSLHLIWKLIKDGNSPLVIDGKACKPNTSTLLGLNSFPRTYQCKCCLGRHQSSS